MKFGRKPTGGKYQKQKKKKLFEIPGQRKTTKLGEEKKKMKRTRGGNKRTFLLKGKIVNIQDKGKSSNAEIKNVLETPSNRFLARQNIITKGTIVETDKGKVRVTNRPTQEGNINGVLLKE